MSADLDSGTLDRARRALAPIEHIVVLMLENRSFDHMLGYLALPRQAIPDRGELPARVNGLRAGDAAFSNRLDDQAFTSAPLDEGAFAERDSDPPHDEASVALQIGPRREMDGFVRAFAQTIEKRG